MSDRLLFFFGAVDWLSGGGGVFGVGSPPAITGVIAGPTISAAENTVSTISSDSFRMRFLLMCRYAILLPNSL
jgi:hypothetical protein